mgnify:CR=1 FL=1
MLVVGFPAGPWGTNCYLVARGAGEQCVIVDPGKDAMPGIDQMVAEHRLSPVAVLLTHGHIDHVWSVVPVCGARGIPAYLHPDDRWQMAAAYERIHAATDEALQELSGGTLTASEPDDLRELSDGVSLEVAGLTFTVLPDPRGDITRAWGMTVFPTTVLVDTQGRPQRVVSGAVDWTGAQAQQWVAALRRS